MRRLLRGAIRRLRVGRQGRWRAKAVQTEPSRRLTSTVCSSLVPSRRWWRAT
ncbi:hypothetical protein [Dankookia sp. P2]|uniref:hypothetical protein n=1 Tax=Dankookia sp. P2 TaxID=3423955 RepID=UPI003D678D68